ncbi:hypothetical protein HBB16_10780 [Pseudonocardia sp. MCCB 268]|nr:hypothetical protein [Pseudonocardia cytotoxica]
MDPTGIPRQTPIFRDPSVQDIAGAAARCAPATPTVAAGQLWFEGDRADDLVIVAVASLRRTASASTAGRDHGGLPAVSMTWRRAVPPEGYLVARPDRHDGQHPAGSGAALPAFMSRHPRPCSGCWSS